MQKNEMKNKQGNKRNKREANPVTDYDLAAVAWW